MKTSNISEETVTTNNETIESISDTYSENNTKQKSSVSEDENSEENPDSFPNKQSLSLNYSCLSTKDYLKTQIPNRPACRRSLDQSNANKPKEKDEELLSKEAELKPIQKYEIKNLSLHQVVKFRAQQGFILVDITKQLVKPTAPTELVSPSKRATQVPANKKERQSFYLITIHFKRYFSQTTILYYKLGYYIAGESSTKQGLADLDLNLKSSSTDSAKTFDGSSLKSNKNNSDKKLDKLFCEILISWDFLHLKARYQNLVLIEQIRCTLNNIQSIDHDKSFDLTATMLNPPELLKLKEPLFKFIQLNDQKNLSLEDFNVLPSIQNQRNNVFTFENSNYELNIRSTKGKFVYWFIPWGDFFEFPGTYAEGVRGIKWVENNIISDLWEML